MLIPLGPSSAAGVTSSPNTQLIKVRLAMQPVAAGASSAYAWPYALQLPPDGGDVLDVPAFDNPVTDPEIIGP